jgi:hypothetical protein
LEPVPLFRRIESIKIEKEVEENDEANNNILTELKEY